MLSRREELDRDLLLQTCSFKVIPGQGRRSSSFSEVSPESGHLSSIINQNFLRRGDTIVQLMCRVGSWEFSTLISHEEDLNLKRKHNFKSIEVRNFQFTLWHSKSEDLEYQSKKALLNKKGL